MEKAPDAFRTISEVAEELDIPQHVLRFWETRFAQIRPMKRGGGRRYYRPDDIDLLRGIRHLLYGEGYTIRGVQRILREHGVKFVQGVWQAGAAQPARDASDEIEGEDEMGEAQDAPAEASLNGPVGERPKPHVVEPEDEASAEEPRDAEVAADEAAPPHVGARPLAGRAPAPQGPVAIGFPREDVRKLQASLHELRECRRLLDEALEEQP